MRKPQTPEKKEEMIRIGNRLNAIRKEAGLSLTDVAERMNRDFGANTNKGMISKYENGIHEPSASTIYCLSRVFGVSVDYINGRTDEKCPPAPKQDCEAVGYSVPVYTSVKNRDDGVTDEATTVLVPNEWRLGGREFFAYRVRDARFAPRYYNNDLVIFERKIKAKKDQVALVGIGGEDAFLALITKKRDGKIITPLDPSRDSKFYTTEEIANLPVVILGIAIELRRQEFEL